MKKYYLTKMSLVKALLGLFALSMMIVPNVFAHGKQDFTLVNATGVEINSVYVSPHNSNEWGDDILGRDTLPDGESVDITFDRQERAAKWDLRVEDKQGNSIEWENLNLLQISKVTLHYKNGKSWADVE